MPVLFTGDTHNDLEIKRISYKNFPYGRMLDKNSVLIVLGDFGFPWNGSPTDKYWLDWCEDRPFQIAFVDGNHVNHSMLAQYPTEEWCGGQTHVLRPHVHHLMRGELFNIEGSTFFTFGGARSTDKVYRKEGISWWPEEIASRKQMEHGVNTLERASFKVDYILTHCAPNKIVDILFPYENQHDDMSNYLEKVVRARTVFKRWFMGHYHIDRSYENQKYNILYNDIIELLPNNEIKVVNN